MKKLNGLLIFSLFIMITCTSVTGVDIVSLQKLNPDEDLLTDKQKEITNFNAHILAFRDMYEDDTSFIEISEQLTEGYYNALVTILTSEAGRQHEIIQEMRIFEYRNLQSLIIEPNSNAPFLEKWRDSVITTNIPEIDNLLVDNRFEISSIHDWSFSENLHFVAESSSFLNTIHLSNLLEQTGYFSSVEINGFVGDGDDIKVQKIPEGFEFTFINSYGDCPAGCINDDKYIFNLYEDGDVKFAGIK